MFFSSYLKIFHVSSKDHILKNNQNIRFNAFSKFQFINFYKIYSEKLQISYTTYNADAIHYGDVILYFRYHQ